MKAKPFREIEKETLTIRVPGKVADKLRKKAFDERRSVAYVGTRVLALGLGMNPAMFGIEDEGEES
jgi:hypothetical protein